METFNKLIIQGKKDDLIELISILIKKLPKNWNYKDENVKSYSDNTSKSITEVMCVESPETDSKNGLVWLRFWEGDLKVINIVPTKPGSLEYNEYNAILDLFYNECVRPNLNDKYSVKYETEGLNVQQIAGDATYRKMNSWEGGCNPSTGNTHPADFKRWAEFVIIAHRENSKLTASVFSRWLIEEKGWNDEFDLTHRLVLEYEYSRDLLEENDKY